VKPAEIPMRLRAQFGDEPLSRTQVYDWSNSFKEGRTEVENMRRLHLLQLKLWPEIFWDSQRVLFLDFLIEQRSTNADYSKLL
jgi:hypothetical protein